LIAPMRVAGVTDISSTFSPGIFRSRRNASTTRMHRSIA
jgi:hypothetical protein